jgi:hypothetical protein
MVQTQIRILLLGTNFKRITIRYLLGGAVSFRPQLELMSLVALLESYVVVEWVVTRGRIHAEEKEQSINCNIMQENISPSSILSGCRPTVLLPCIKKDANKAKRKLN